MICENDRYVPRYMIFSPFHKCFNIYNNKKQDVQINLEANYPMYVIDNKYIYRKDSGEICMSYSLQFSFSNPISQYEN